jgi:hypothetical protein
VIFGLIVTATEIDGESFSGKKEQPLLMGNLGEGEDLKIELCKLDLLEDMDLQK